MTQVTFVASFVTLDFEPGALERRRALVANRRLAFFLNERYGRPFKEIEDWRVFCDLDTNFCYLAMLRWPCSTQRAYQPLLMWLRPSSTTFLHCDLNSEDRVEVPYVPLTQVSGSEYVIGSLLIFHNCGIVKRTAKSSELCWKFVAD